MKNNYKRIVQEPYFNNWKGVWEDRWTAQNIGRYTFSFFSYYRYVKTFNEIRQNEAAVIDGYRVRGPRRKRGLPTVYDDPMVSRKWGRSWKDFTKYRKQYMKNL